MFKTENGNMKLGDDVQKSSFRLTVEISMFLLMFGTFLSCNVITNILLHKTCINTLNRPESECALLLAPGPKSNETRQLENDAQQYVTIVTMVHSVSGAVIPAIISLFLGSWSDKYGRKPLLTWSLLGVSLSSLLTVLFATVNSLGPWWYVFTIVPSSLSGGATAFFTGAFCYVSDITTEADRSFRITLLQMGLLAGIIVGTFSSPYLLHLVGNIPLLSVVAVAHTLAYVYNLVWIKESVKKATKGKLSSLFDMSLVKSLIITFTKKRPNKERAILYLLIVCCSFSIPYTGSLDYLYTRNKLHWSLEAYSVFSVVNTLTVIAGSLFSVSLFEKKFNIGDAWLTSLSYLSYIVDYVIKALATLTWHMYVGAVLSTFSGLANPLTRSMLSKLLPQEDLGKIFTLISISNSVVQIITPLLLNPLYSATLNDFPGSIYLVCAAIHVMNLVFLCLAKYYMRRHSSASREDIITPSQQ